MTVKTCTYIPLSDIIEALAKHPDCFYDSDDLSESFCNHCHVTYGDVNRSLVTEDIVWSVLNDMDELPSAVIADVAAKLVEVGRLNNGKVPYIDLSN